MKKTICVIAGTLLLGFGGPQAFAGGPAETLSQGAEHSVNAVAHSGGASVQAAAAVVSLPFLAVAKAPTFSGQIGESLWEFSSEPLPLAAEPITTGPAPNVALFEE